MPKLYIFAIGGTGSRVVKSLTMLLASGVKTNYEIVPIILDPDASAADVSRTTRLLNNYRIINKSVDPNLKNSFFSNRIESLGDVVGASTGESISNEFRLNIADLHGGSFSKFIDYNSLDKSNDALISLLFSKSNLDLSLEVGFQGNPNIGSVVLNKFTESIEYLQFVQNFQKEDKIFIISSIFGGTGAAGFPLILKNIREGSASGHYNDHLKNAVVGAVTVLPYFKLDGDNSEAIQSSTFISKTKAALGYYHKNLSGNRSINALYYIGDNASNNYKNIVGGVGQKNDAHFVELASALAILDFADEATLNTENGRAVDPKYLEFGIDSIDLNNPIITFNNLALETQKRFKLPLTQLFFATQYLDNELSKTKKSPFAVEEPRIDDNFLNSQFYSSISAFLKEFKIWLAELKRNKLSFAPYYIVETTDTEGNITGFTTSDQDIFNFVTGIPKRQRSLWQKFKKSGDSYDIITGNLNSYSKGKNFSNAESKFLEIFSHATADSISDELF
ncbi:hypothetical protein J5U18_04625 [Sphingobacteriaceae bacterium WQ 2009]|uniref:Tubulin/FtsZ family, GTPase domain n=1 Tax=Rhinopithecimicrobium faecis TaxID=2820698 RepID=A0A8T4H8Z0_9SPHI|nr:hypothetical protein [Sphingobacteriaceae bacterium WQ 2009]